MNQISNIFGKVKSQIGEDSIKECELMDGILGRFDKESNCFAFYKQGEGATIDSIVYITKNFLEKHKDVQSLEKTVLNYLQQKKGMQATFKTSGIDELPLIKKA